MASGGIPTIHPNPAKPDTGLAIACLAAILLILPILSIHVESSSPMDEQDRQDQWSGWVQPLTPNEECLFRRRSVPPPSRLGAGGDPEPWADAHGYLLPPLRGCLWNLSQASTFQMFHPRMIRPAGRGPHLSETNLGSGDGKPVQQIERKGVGEELTTSGGLSRKDTEPHPAIPGVWSRRRA